MSRTLRFDSKGNDITPLCEIADGIVLDNGCGECILKNNCPGYYDGCFEAVNGSDREDRSTACGEIIKKLDEYVVMLNGLRSHYPDTGTSGMADVLRSAIALLRTHPDTRPNEPLTEEEIKEMVGEPVYYPQGPDGKRWLIVDYIAITAVIGGAQLYRRPPKEEER